MPERGPDVADGVADPVGVHHRDRDAPLAAVAVEDRLVDLQPPRGLHVDVDVGQRAAQRGEEPLHQQAVAQRVDPGDAEQVVDQAARPRPPGGAADPELADQVGDVADGEEVRRVAERPDDLELVVEPLPDPLPRGGCRSAGRSASHRAAAGRRRRTPAGAVSGAGWAWRPRSSAGWARAPPARVRPASNSGKCTSPSPRSARGSSDAPVGDRAGVGEQRRGRRGRPGRRSGRSPRRPRPSACRTSGSPRRCPGRRGAGPAGPAGGRRRGRRRRRVDPVGVADRVAEQTGPWCAATRARPAIRAACGDGPGPGPGQPVGDQLDEQVARVDAAPATGPAPRGRGRRGAAWLPGPARRPGPSSTRTSPPATCSATRSRVHTGSPRSPARWVAETSRHTAAQPRRPLARKVTRGSRRSRKAPPRAGVRAEPAAWRSTVRTPNRAGRGRRPGRRRGSAGRPPAGTPWRTGPRRRCRRGR